MRKFVTLLIAMSALALGAENSERLSFPTGGTLNLKNSVGELTIEGWDQPDVEITTTKFAKREYTHPERPADATLLDKVKVTSERKDNELLITTQFPKHPFIERLVVGETDFELTYVIKVPREAKLVIDHQMGEVHVDGITGDMQVMDHMGEITVHLPEDGKYAIDAHSKLGSVVSDFTGRQHRGTLWLGSQFVGDQSSGQKLKLRVGTGDIIILKERKPLPPNLYPARGF